MASKSPNPFEVFQLPARPWLSADDIQARFLQLAAKFHPDSHPQSQAEGHFQAITEAHQLLKDPVRRLAAALQLNAPELLSQANDQFIPAALPELFMSIGTLQREVSAFCAQFSEGATHPENQSALKKALLESERQSLRGDVTKLIGEAAVLWARCENQIQAVDALWERRTPEMLRQLAGVYREMSYLQRWSSQLKESRLQLDSLA